MLKEFKEFALKGNVIDMGVGIIIGAAFGKVVTSFVTDLMTPPLGFLLGKVNFSSLFLNLSGKTYGSLADAKAAGAPTLNYGLFLNNVIDFLMVSIALFFLIRWINGLRPPQPQAAPETRACPECLSNVPLHARRCAFCATPLTPPP